MINFPFNEFYTQKLKIKLSKKIENAKYVSHFIFLLAIINNLNG